jgi:hypothetical protein
MGAIRLDGKKAAIDWDACVECGICTRQAECPKGAIFEPEETAKWPRAVRKVFSDPTAKHENTGCRGRGTEEIKTNDITGRFKRGFVGMALEFGRPSVGTKIKDIEVVTVPLARKKVAFEPCNPSTSLFDTTTGLAKEDVRDEKVLSAIVEFAIPESDLEEVVRIILDASKKCDTVFSWGIAACYDPDGTLPIVERFENMGMRVPKNAKVNIGLGRALKEG